MAEALNWDGVPYELQSPTWRSAMNNDGKAGAWDPSLNTSYVDKFASAFESMRNSQTVQNTVQKEGQTGYVTSLTDSLGSIFRMIGSTGDNAQAAQPVAYQPAGQRSPNWPMILLVLGGVGVVYYASSKR